MKTFFISIIIIISLMISVERANAEGADLIDSLKNELELVDGKDKIEILNTLCWKLRNSNIHESIHYGLKSIELSKRYNDFEGLTRAYGYTGVAYRNLGNYSEALDFYFKGLQLAQKYDFIEELGYAYINIGNLYIYQKLYKDASVYLGKARLIAEEVNNKTMMAYCDLNFGRISLQLKEYSKAHTYLNESLKLRTELNDTNEQAVCYMYIGDVYFAQDDFANALRSYLISKDLLEHQMDLDLLANLNIKISNVWLKQKHYQNALFFAEKSLEISMKIQSKLRIRNAYTTLVPIYNELKNYKTVSEYYRQILLYNDSLFDSQINEKIAYIKFIEKQNLYEKLISERMYRDQLEIHKQKQLRNYLVALSLILILLSIVLYAFFKSKRKHNYLLSQKNNQISEHKVELEDLVDKLSEAKKQADEANRLKSEFLTNISHEIRTPMNAIVGFSDLLRQKVKIPEQLSYVDKIILSSSNLLGLINQILDLSKIEAGKLSIQNDATNIRMIVEEIEEIFSESVNAKGLFLKTDIDDHFPAEIMIDSLRLRQIIMNLVSNGIKFTTEGGVQININIESISVNQLDFNILVTDTGIGIPTNQIQNIFEVFRQVDGQNEKIYGGTGLGLSITKNLVEMMNGVIAVDSKIGEGSSFKISFHGIEFSQINTQEKNSNGNGKINVPNLKILNADDSEINRELVKRMFEGEDFELYEASDGNEVLEMMETLHPDIILMDIRMPKKDGFETAQIIKNDKRFNKIPIIALTANIMQSEIERIKSLFDDYISKPITKRDLMLVISKYSSSRLE